MKKNIDTVIDESFSNACIQSLGIEKAMIIAMEECAELQKAISKFLRGKGDYENLCEEIADVIICLGWTQNAFNVENTDVQNWINYKTNRCLERIENKTFK